MKLGEIYRKIVDMGIEADPRGRERVNQILEKSKKALDKQEGRKKEFADKDVTWNPYTDCRLLYGDDDREITSLLCGIDIGTWGNNVKFRAIVTEVSSDIDLVASPHSDGG